MSDCDLDSSFLDNIDMALDLRFSDLFSSIGKLATRVDLSAILMKKFSRLILFVK